MILLMEDREATAVEAFAFQFELVGSGWAAATLRSGPATVRVRASYLGDALGDLLAATWTLLDGDDLARCSWWEEPGEYRWLFIRTGQQVDLQILWFDELRANQPDEFGRLAFSTTQPLQRFAAATASGAAACLRTHGLQGYRAKWVDNDFPSDELAAIEAALGRVD